MAEPRIAEPPGKAGRGDSRADGGGVAQGPGSVQFLDPLDRDAPADPRILAVHVAAVTDQRRGQLAALIDQAIEVAIAARGGDSPGASAEGADERLGDQVRRAREVGAARLVVVLPRLTPLARADRALGPEDSLALVFWSKATHGHPVDLLLDAGDTLLGAHLIPVPLRIALDAASPARPAGPGEIVASEHEVVRAATAALGAARGPQPLAVIERLFVESYLPLDSALRDPSRPPDRRAVRARDEFRVNFARVYQEASRAFGVTGKRPRMVLDAPAVAAKIARQTSARSVQLLLVDGMRHDVGTRVKDALVRTLGRRATLADESVLWAALPTTTNHQLATLAQGTSAVDDASEDEGDDAVLRGRTAQIIRRLKAGARDVHRLDLCDVRVRDAAERTLIMLPSIAEDVAATIARHALSLEPRTLLFVFGDHGFTFGPDGAPCSGGASPEEVLVPAFAMLLGQAH